MAKEIWKPIIGAEGFLEVSNMGRVRSVYEGHQKILREYRNGSGYRRFETRVSGEKFSGLVHRAVAKAFIPNPENKPEVNHKDGNKENNAVENLEWATRMENVRHAIENGLWDSVFEGTRRENEKRKRPVIGYFTSDTKSAVRRFESVSEAERFIGSHHVVDVLKGRMDGLKGWTFRYEHQ